MLQLYAAYNIVKTITSTNVVKNIQKSFKSNKSAKKDTGKTSAKTTNLKNNANCQIGKAEDEQCALEINGKIEESKQGKNVGDCYLLSAINSVAISNPDFFKDVVQDKGDYVEVKFRGVKKYNKDENAYNCLTYKISKDALCDDNNSKKYSSGDKDVKAIEIAYEQLRGDIKNGKIDGSSFEQDVNNIMDDSLLKGGVSADTMKLITGKKTAHYGVTKIQNMWQKYGDDLLDSFKTSALCCGFIQTTNTVKSGHMYTISSYDKKTVTLINTWDSSKTIVMSKIDFYDNLECLDVCDLNGPNDWCEPTKNDYSMHNIIE